MLVFNHGVILSERLWIDQVHHGIVFQLDFIFPYMPGYGGRCGLKHPLNSATHELAIGFGLLL